MDVNIVDTEVLARHTRVQVVAYLESRGWHSTQSEPSGAYWTNGIAPSDVEIWLPSSDQIKTFPARLAAVLRQLSNVEGRPQLQILLEMRHSLSDIQQIRTFPPGESGTAPLVDGAEVVDGLRRWIEAAATSASLPEQRRVLPRRKSAQVAHFLGRARLAAPSEGSFIWKVITPVADRSQEPLNVDATPNSVFDDFARRTTKLLYDATRLSLGAATEVLNGTDNLDPFIRLVDSGISANLCEALVSTGAEQASPFEMSFSWATHMPVSERNETLAFGRDHLSVIKEAAVELRKVGTETDVILTGLVVRLVTEGTADRITVAGVVDDEGDSTVGHFWLELGAADYHEAAEAHTERFTVRVMGDLEYDGNRRWLRNPSGFTVLREGPDSA